MKRQLIIPEGTIDYLPEEAFARRKVAGLLLNQFSLWGYDEVKTPLIENWNVIKKTTGEEAKFFTLMDRTGDILALRPEFTAPIARMVGAHFNDSKSLPLRLAYFGDIFFQNSLKDGKKRQKTQVGIELIGAGSLKSDCEVLVMALETMGNGTLRGPSLGIGHMGITESLLEELVKDLETIRVIKELMIRKDLVALEKLLNKVLTKEDGKKILTLATQNGSWEFLEVIKNYSESSVFRDAVSRLESIYNLLKDLGYGKEVFFDFSILGDFEYYTGIVFEGYAEGMGSPVLRGGRYDGLLEEYTFKAPSIGFALNLDLYMKNITQDYPLPKVEMVVAEDDLLTGFQRCRDYHLKGQKTTIDLEDHDEGIF